MNPPSHRLAYQAFLRYPALPSMWHSVSGRVTSENVAIDWILHYLRWVELHAREGNLVDDDNRHMSPVGAIVEAPELHAAVVAIEDNLRPWPAHLDRLPQHHVVRALRLARAVPASSPRWVWRLDHAADAASI